jgi:hypothetical protein
VDEFELLGCGRLPCERENGIRVECRGLTAGGHCSNVWKLEPGRDLRPEKSPQEDNDHKRYREEGKRLNVDETCAVFREEIEERARATQFFE